MKLTFGLVLILLGTVQNRNEAHSIPIKGYSGEVTPSDAPDLCQCPEIDAVTKTKEGNSYVFKGEYYWRILDTGIADGYPRVIKDDWDGLPGNVDAALTWVDGKTFFFKDFRYWRFLNNKMESGYPKEINDGFRGIPNNIDAALRWSGNDKTYFFKGSQYWRFDSGNEDPVSDAYPKPISSWKGIPNDVDAAFQWDNGRTFFFKDQGYYTFNDNTFAVYEANPSYPRPTAVWWFACKGTSKTYPAKSCSVDKSEVTERISGTEDHPVTETTTINATTQPESTPVAHKDTKLPEKGSYDVGIWDDYPTTDESTVNSVGSWEESSTTDYTTTDDNSLSERTFTVNITVNFPNTPLSTTAVEKNKQSKVLSDMFLLLNMLLILFY